MHTEQLECVMKMKMHMKSVFISNVILGYSIQLLKIIQRFFKKTLYRRITGTATR